MTVEAIIFDAGLTLVGADPSFPEVFLRALDEQGISLDLDHFRTHGEKMGHAFREHDEAWRAAGRPSPHVGDEPAEQEYWTDLYAVMLEKLGLEIDHRAVGAHINHTFRQPAAWTTFDDVHDVLDDLRVRGLKVGLLSNWAPWLRELLDAEDLTERFDEIVVSGEEGVEKPDPRIFQIALERMGLEPGPHVVYVGDDLKADVEGSEALGLRSVLVDRRDFHLKFAGHRVRDLTELAGALNLQ